MSLPRLRRPHDAAVAALPIDNSPTERELQNVAKLRLNMLFAGSTEGAHRACVLRGIVATCRAIGVPAQAYLAWVYDRLGTHRDVFALPLEDMRLRPSMRRPSAERELRVDGVPRGRALCIRLR
ncbi:MAG: hypothetical protein VYE22_06335 [Myxococcota bacterium]|nr:hypothetical protein [Myxococcota bacterium]